MPVSELRSGPFAALFARTFDFSDLVPLYGRAFAEGLAKAWESANRLERPQPAVKRLAAVKRLLAWLASQDVAADATVACEVYRNLRDGKGPFIPEVDWRDAVNGFCDRLRDQTCTEVIDSPNVLTRRSIIHFLSAGLRQIADVGFLPHAGPLKGCGRGQLSGGNIPSLCELSPGQRLRQAFPQPLPNQDINALAELSRARLSALRTCAVRRLVREYETFKRGNQLMQRSSLPSPDKFEAELETRVMSRLLSILPNDPDGRLGGLLRFVNARRQNRLFVKIERYPMQVLVAQLGGAEFIVRHLEGTIDALVAAYTIVLVDTGFDIGTCDDLPANPFVGEVRSGRQRIATISATKARAGGKIAEGTLLDGEFDLQIKLPGQDLPSVAAVRMWQEMSEPLRARAAGSEAANKLWIIASGSLNQGSPRLCDAAAFKEAWNRFLEEIKDDKCIGGLPIRTHPVSTAEIMCCGAA